MGKTDVRNWMRLNLLLDCATISFRTLFAKVWKEQRGHEWTREDSQIILKHKDFKRLQKIQRGMVEGGDIDNWDISLLRDVLTAKKLLHLPSEQTEQINRIRSVRNELAHHATKIITDEEFSQKWDNITDILVKFGESKAKFDELKQNNRVGGLEFMPGNEGIDEESIEEAAQIKVKGKAEFDGGNYTEAIQTFTKGIVLPKLPLTDQAILHWNRCEAHLKTYEAMNARSERQFNNFFNFDFNSKLVAAKLDAKKVIKYWPDWWRGYYSLGKVYLAMGKLKKSQEIFSDALAKEPQKQEIINASLEEVREKLGLVGTVFMDLKNVAKSKADFVRDIGGYLRSNNDLLFKIVDDLCSRCDSSELDSFKDCRLGHQTQLGLDGSPSDYRLAAQYYRKAADRRSVEGKFYLGLMILNGEGVKKDISLGMKLLREVAEQPSNVSGLPNTGVAEAEFVLGLCHEDGVGVPVNFTKAKELYQLSSDHGCSKAANNLGLLCEYGIGLPDNKSDLEKAELLYLRAARSGWMPDSNGMLNLAKIYEEKGDLLNAIAWCHCAEMAQNKLPLCQKSIDRLQKKLIELSENHGSSNLEETNCAKSNDSENRNNIDGKIRSLHVNSLSTYSRYRSFRLEDISKPSIYGKRLLEAKENSLKALSVMSQEIGDDVQNASLDSLRKFVEYFSKGAQIEFRVFEFSLQQHLQAFRILTGLLKQKTSFDEDVRVCYIAVECLKQSSVDLNAYLDKTIESYPKNSFFWRRRAHQKVLNRAFIDALSDINSALQCNPKNADILHEKAEITLLALPTLKPQTTKVAYEQFLALAPEDHPGVPDAYYALAQLEFVFLNPHAIFKSTDTVNEKRLVKCWKEAKKNYDLGVSAEEKQIQVFHPHESFIKGNVTHVLAITLGLLETSRSPSCTSNVGTPAATSQPVGSGTPNSKLEDPKRIAQITNYRTWLRGCRAKGAKASDYLAFANELPETVTKPVTVLGLKAILFRDMEVTADKLFEKRTIAVTIIDEVGVFENSLVLLIEDEENNVEICVLHNCLSGRDASSVREKYVLGRKLSIVDPFVRTMKDCRRAIFVDNQRGVFTQTLLLNVCRYCCKPNAERKCSRCKVSRYCGKDCQVSDWNVLNHKCICKRSRN